MQRTSATFRDLLERPGAEPEAPAPVPQEAAAYEAFSFGRVGAAAQLTLLFRQANGAVFGFPYASLSGLRSDDPAAGFTLDFCGVEVTVSGRNLGRLFRYVCDHKAAEIEQARRANLFQNGEDAAVVETIVLRG